MNFADVLDIAACRAPDHEAMSLSDRTLTYAGLRDRARRVAGLLRGAGLRRGDKVGLVFHNAFEFTEIFFGAAGIGATVVPVNPRLAVGEMAYVLDHAEVSAAFVGSDLCSAVGAELTGRLPHVRAWYVVGDSAAETRFGEPFAAALASASPVAEWERMAPQDDCVIVYTSGTTGRPKGAVRSHQSALWGAANFVTAHGEISGRDRFLYAIPLASIGFVNVFASCLFAGFPVELMYRFDPSEAVRLIERRKVTHTYFVPSMWRMVLHTPESRAADTSSLRVGIWGGEPLDARLRSAVIERFGPVLVGVYGSTEAALLAARPGDDAVRPGTAGRAAGYNLFKVVDDSGAEVPRGTVGELVCSGPALMSRYHRNPDATAEVLEQGWYRTGDLASMDVDGYVFVVDRKREMLISGGQNVYPAEVERVLSDHPAVAAVAVIGVPDDSWGEVPMAYVVTTASGATTEETLAQHARAELAKYKVPKHWRFVAELPLTATGKVRKNILREWATETRHAAH